MNRNCLALAAFAIAALVCGGAANAQMPEYPPFTDVANGFTQVNPPPGTTSMYNLWLRQKDNRLLAELPPAYASTKYFIALTVASGEPYAGLQAGDVYVYWRQYDKRLALIMPQLVIRSTGDPESQSSVRRLFTDRVLLDVPILTMGPTGGPVIDLGAMLMGQSYLFFPTAQVTNPALAAVKTAKAFPQNVEVSFEAPTVGGILKTLHYSISAIPENTGYQPRLADQRVGYFTTSYNDLGKFQEDETAVRYINRWRLEKRDPSLKLSPPVNPIVFYIEHTTPVRYRPWVQRGIEAWNVAFEKVGIRGAIKVEQQDAVANHHMDKDPEDVRFNFVRWLSNDISTAIGPSRVHPMTGEILDADIILTDGWIRHYVDQHKNVLPAMAMESFGPETLAWLASHPRWDPRYLLTAPAERPEMLRQLARLARLPYAGHPLANVDPSMLGDDEYDGLVGRHTQCNGMCMAAQYQGLKLATLRMMLEIGLDDDAPFDPDTQSGDLLDGMPEEFIGMLLAELTAHEVGHTLGLRHNFKASSIYSLADINSAKVKGQAFSGSVMDYLPVNINMQDGEMQGDYSMVGIGPYDMWAIEYGYSFESDLKPILCRVSEPALQFATDEDTWGPDPLARRYDFSANPLDYAKSQVRLAAHHRERVLERFVKEGESWAKARLGYEMTLFLQARGLFNMADWIGGTFVNRDKKGDPGARRPIEVVSVQAQRDALKFVIDNTFVDSAFGLTPDLLNHMSIDQWIDVTGNISFGEATWPVHEQIMSLQASVLTSLVNPTTLQLVYDNELRTPADADMLTLPELLDTIGSSIWSELDALPTAQATPRRPWISSLRRNLQREHLDRLIDLTLPESLLTAAYKPVSNLAVHRLRALQARIAQALAQESLLDAYSMAHLSEARLRIEKALDADYIYNIGSAFGAGGGMPIFFHEESD